MVWTNILAESILISDWNWSRIRKKILCFDIIGFRYVTQDYVKCVVTSFCNKKV